MTVEIKKKAGKSKVCLIQGNQEFTFDFEGDRKQLIWYKKMVHKAIKSYREEIRND